MQIDVRTIQIEPQRKAYDHLVRRFGDKPASRYQEGSYDLQATENLHYRPTWAPEQLLYDDTLSQIRMKDWYVLKDPRQFFYSTYTLTRARQQETVESNFKSFESLGLVSTIPDELQEKLLKVLVPLRHMNWGGNLNNTFMCGYGYGVVFTQPCIYQAMDNLGIAQYLSRIGLILDDVDGLNDAKTDWLEAEHWQPMRRYVEKSMTIRDPIESFIVQNVALDGLLYPLIYQKIIDERFASEGGGSIALLTQFMTNWHIETKRWIDSVVKVMAAESEENKAILNGWVNEWSAKAADVLKPIAELAVGSDAQELMEENQTAFAARMKKLGLSL